MTHPPAQGEPTAEQIQLWADQIESMIADDIAEGIVPPTVRTFAELHSYTDANMYALSVAPPEIPWGSDVATADDEAGVRHLNAVEDEVSRRLVPCPETGVTGVLCRCDAHAGAGSSQRPVDGPRWLKIGDIIEVDD